MARRNRRFTAALRLQPSALAKDLATEYRSSSSVIDNLIVQRVVIW